LMGEARVALELPELEPEELEQLEVLEEQEERILPGGTAAVTVWIRDRGRVYEKRPQPPFSVDVPRMRACGEKARPLISKAMELAVAETGYRILVLWVPDDPFTGSVYYLVPLKMKLRGRKRLCVRVFRDLEDAVQYAGRPPRSTEPA